MGSGMYPSFTHSLWHLFLPGNQVCYTPPLPPLPLLPPFPPAARDSMLMHFAKVFPLSLSFPCSIRLHAHALRQGLSPLPLLPPAARDSMLMRFAKVSPEGEYAPPPPSNSKASYATMLFVRADIVKNAGGVLSKAVTIATRYAAVRRQTAVKAGEAETQVTCTTVRPPSPPHPHPDSGQGREGGGAGA